MADLTKEDLQAALEAALPLTAKLKSAAFTLVLGINGQGAIVSPEGANRARLVAFLIEASAATDAKIQNFDTVATRSDLTGTFNLGVNGKLVSPSSPLGLIDNLGTGHVIELHSAAAATLRGFVSWLEWTP